MWSDVKLSESLLGLQGQPVKSIMATTVKVLQAFFFQKICGCMTFFFLLRSQFTLTIQFSLKNITNGGRSRSAFK